MATKSEEKIITTKDMMEIFEVSRTMIAKWCQQGMPKRRRGMFAIRECIAWRIENERTKTNERVKTESARQRLGKARAKLLEMEVEQLRNSLIPTSTVEKILNDLFSIIDEEFERLCKTTAPKAIKLSSSQLLASMINAETNNCRKTISDRVANYAYTLTLDESTHSSKRKTNETR